jgi:DNA-directed RNA polymerase specialized sigma subunit
VSSISDRWEPRHKDALRAWKQGDTERLIELCNLEIRSAIRKAIGRYRELTDIQGAQEELQASARKGVEKAAGRYDPSKGPPFQAYAQKDIYWETRRRAEALLTEIRHQEALQNEARQGRVPEEVDQEAESTEEQTGRGLEGAFESLALDEWRDRIKRLDKDNISILRSFLDKKKTELTRGERRRERKYEAILANVIERGIVLQLSVPGAKFKKISGPLEVHTLRVMHKALGWSAESVSYSNIARLVSKPGHSVSDKTIKKWDERITENPEYEESELLDRLHSIVNPRGWRSFQRRRQAE